jgi:phosphoglycerate dehydrogenase-like enzyme
MRLVLLTSWACELEEILRRKLTTTWEILRAPDTASREEVAAALAEAEAVLCMVYEKGTPPAPKLRFLQCGGAGWDRIAVEGLPPGVAVANCFGHEQAIGEYVLMAMLASSHDLMEADRSFREGSWRMSGRFGAPIHDEIGGRTVGIIGLGRIGRAVARLAKAFGMRVLGCNRTRREDPNVERLYALDELHPFLAECDFVVMAAALAPETTGLVDRAAFRAMRRHAVLINVGRGESVEEDALWEALRDRTIAGAVIDAWYNYPKSRHELEVAPSRHPFHELPNLIMTPHVAAWTHGMIDRRLGEIAENFDRFARGETVRNIVHRT